MKPSFLVTLATLALATAIPTTHRPSQRSPAAPVPRDGAATSSAPKKLNVYFAAGFNPGRTPVTYFVLNEAERFPVDKNCPRLIERVNPTSNGALLQEGIAAVNDDGNGAGLLELNVQDIGYYRIREDKKAQDGTWNLEDRQGKTAGTCQRLTTEAVKRCNTDGLRWTAQLQFQCSVGAGAVEVAEQVAAVGDGA